MADGGEGTVDAFLHTGAKWRAARVHGPLGDPVDAAFALRDRTAVIEMSAASGLSLLDPERRDAVHADTYGTGELLRAAADAGATRIIIGIGGSATTDAGTGMLRALGARFVDETGTPLDRAILAYRRLEEIDLAEFDRRFENITIAIAADVDNPLYGPDGAPRTFGPQKGVNDAQIPLLDAAFERIADVAAETLGRDERDSPGAGAAGGLGYALLEFLRGKMERGVEAVAREQHLGDALHGADLCVTGEGKIDEQTLHGKTIDGVARIAEDAGVPVVAFGGAVDDDAKQRLEARGVAVRGISPAGMNAEESMRRAAELLERAARDYAGEFERS